MELLGKKWMSQDDEDEEEDEEDEDSLSLYSFPEIRKSSGTFQLYSIHILYHCS
jgi:hypothetical protein